MNSLGDYVIAFCGFGVVCCGAGVLALLAFGKLTGATMLFPALTMFSSMLFGEKENTQDNEDPDYRRPRRKGGARDFRARAQAAKMDFGAGSRKPKRDSASPIAPRNFGDSDADDDFDRPSLRSNRNRPGRDMRRSGQDSADDEVFGGMFDEDGDGFPDV
jgi:hypothetical protein